MKSPNIFLHYWATKDSLMTFQEILGQDIHTEILDKIQTEIQRQLNSDKLPEIFPCFDWENERFVERWEALSKTLLLQVQLPQEIWESWINEIANEVDITALEQVINPFDDPHFAHFELNEDIHPLLSAEVYFQKTEGLEELEERREEREERKEETKDVHEVKNEANAHNEPKNILEQLQAAPEEKFFETIAVSNSSLKNLVESKMTEQLSETISINQKIQFILQLFEGDSEKFNELIQFIDQEANASNWQNELNKRYISFQNQVNLEAWKDFYLLVQRKFN